MRSLYKLFEGCSGPGNCRNNQEESLGLLAVDEIPGMLRIPGLKFSHCLPISPFEGVLMSESFVPAAQYLRMSTDRQQLDNQADAIARYAAEHGFQIVKGVLPRRPKWPTFEEPKAWTHQIVFNAIMNPKYAGWNVFIPSGRFSQKRWTILKISSADS